jgi:hypothetical protein
MNPRPSIVSVSGTWADRSSWRGVIGVAPPNPVDATACKVPTA